jgi:hypothetical protein
MSTRPKQRGSTAECDLVVRHDNSVLWGFGFSHAIVDVSCPSNGPDRRVPICEAFVHLYTQFNARGTHDEPAEPACVHTRIQINHPITTAFHRTRVFQSSSHITSPVIFGHNCIHHVTCQVRIPIILFRLRGFLCFLDGVCNHGLVVETESYMANVLLPSPGCGIFLCLPHSLPRRSNISCSLTNPTASFLILFFTFE